jgi:hypothetical protein
MFTSEMKPGHWVKTTIAEGDRVVLHLGDEQVLVSGVRSIGPNRYRGTIYGFEPSVALEFQGLKLDQEIEFDEDQVHGCG